MDWEFAKQNTISLGAYIIITDNDIAGEGIWYASETVIKISIYSQFLGRGFGISNEMHWSMLSPDSVEALLLEIITSIAFSLRQTK